MGYTHYFHLPKGEIETDAWNKFSSSIQSITQNDEWSEKEITINDDVIIVKGSYEWFVVERNQFDRYRPHNDMVFNFTKTNRRDYDYIIVACLFALKQAIPNARISSDGDLDELADGINHFQETCDVSPQEIGLLIKGCDM